MSTYFNCNYCGLNKQTHWFDLICFFTSPPKVDWFLHCNEVWTNVAGNLRTHVEAKHEGICYACDQCEYKATQPGNLQRHVNSMHKGTFYHCGQGLMWL